MNHEEELEKSLQKNAQAIEALSIQLERLSGQVDELYSELNVTPEQLSAFIEKKEHFTEENWNSLNEQRQKLEAKLLLDLANVRNPLKNKKTYAERHVQPHWIFVR